MTVEIISRSISTKVWYRAGIELATPGSAVRHASVARHVTDCAMRPGIQIKGRSLLGIKAVDFHREVCDIYGEDQMSHRT